MTSADRHFGKAVDIKPENGEAWANRGSVALLLEDYEPSAVDLERALAYPHALINIGLTRANLGWAYFTRGVTRSGEGAASWRRVQPGMWWRSTMGRVYFARKEWNKALDSSSCCEQ